MADPAARDPVALLPLTPPHFHVLLSLADGDKHGYAILKDVETRTGGEVVLSSGTLYGVIKRCLAEGLIRTSAAGSDDRRTAYRLTAFGRKVAVAETERLRAIVASARQLLQEPGV